MGEFSIALIKPTIGTDVLDKVDIRVGTITSIDDIAAAEKLVKQALGEHSVAEYGHRTLCCKVLDD